MDTVIDELETIKQLCAIYYDEATFAHAERVAGFVEQDFCWQEKPDFLKFCQMLAFAHDLWENTDCPRSLFTGPFYEAMSLITNDGDPYDAYCTQIHDARHTYAGQAAWFVKLQDMKDHLMLRDTLTDRLKEKYLSGLRFLL